ncbi:MAG: STAS domain-containing protein [Pseudomonadota bacterium]
MSFDITSNAQDDSVTLKLSGRFDYEAHDSFVASYSDKLGFTKYIVDMKATDYLDSSALGMLLLLKDFAESNSAKVSLTQVNDDVRKILEIASFDQIFSID